MPQGCKPTSPTQPPLRRAPWLAIKGAIAAMSNTELLSRITANQNTLGGKLTIRNMRISVELILSLMAQGADQAELLDDYPDLEPEDIRACIAYAHAVISGDAIDAVTIESV